MEPTQPSPLLTITQGSYWPRHLFSPLCIRLSGFNCFLNPRWWFFCRPCVSSQPPWNFLGCSTRHPVAKGVLRRINDCFACDRGQYFSLRGLVPRLSEPMGAPSLFFITLLLNLMTAPEISYMDRLVKEAFHYLIVYNLNLCNTTIRFSVLLSSEEIFGFGGRVKNYHQDASWAARFHTGCVSSTLDQFRNVSKSINSIRFTTRNVTLALDELKQDLTKREAQLATLRDVYADFE